MQRKAKKHIAQNKLHFLGQTICMDQLEGLETKERTNDLWRGASGPKCGPSETFAIAEIAIIAKDKLGLSCAKLSPA